jgi:hypothetical protein
MGKVNLYFVGFNMLLGPEKPKPAAQTKRQDKQGRTVLKL